MELPEVIHSEKIGVSV